MSSIREFGSRIPGITYVERPGAYAFILDAQNRLAIVRTGLGFFLPGGGAEAGESLETALKREVFEEIGYTIVSAQAVGQAAQFHWSEFYKSHFRKVGTFFRVQATAPAVPAFQNDHELVWLAKPQAARQLTQEFQRFAVSEFS